jgi:hypothetical protein
LGNPSKESHIKPIIANTNFFSGMVVPLENDGKKLTGRLIGQPRKGPDTVVIAWKSARADADGKMWFNYRIKIGNGRAADARSRLPMKALYKQA